MASVSWTLGRSSKIMAKPGILTLFAGYYISNVHSLLRSDHMCGWPSLLSEHKYPNRERTPLWGWPAAGAQTRVALLATAWSVRWSRAPRRARRARATSVRASRHHLVQPLRRIVAHLARVPAQVV